MFKKKTIRDISLENKRVLLRADYNVPVKNGEIANDYRIKQSLPTIEYILKQKDSSLVITSHLGRPKDANDKSCSLKPVAKRLAELLDKRVLFAPDCVGEEAKKIVAQLEPGGVLVLENVRFHQEEEKNDAAFAKAIVETSGAQAFVQDGFGVVHRAHATTDVITKLLPSVAGLLLEQEVDTITNVMEKPQHPLVAVVGGAKISDKIEVVKRLIDMADCVAIGGAMANAFLKIQGHPIGKSLYDKTEKQIAHEVMKKAEAKAAKESFLFLLPVDVVVSKSIDGKSPARIVDLTNHTLSDIEAYPKIPAPSHYKVAADEAILDIGPISAARIGGVISMSKTVIWNGTLGMAEVKGIAGAQPPFAHGTRMVVEAMIGLNNKHPMKPYTLVGGGDTAAFIESEDMVEDFNHVSTGGGASLDLMSGKKLPGVESLQDKK